MTSIRLASFTRYHLNLREGLGLPAEGPSQGSQFLPASDAIFSLGTAAFYHPYFNVLPPPRSRIEKEVKRLLGEIRFLGEQATVDELAKLGPDAVDPLIGFLEGIGTDVSRLPSKARQKVGFHVAVNALGRLGGERAASALLPWLDRVSGDRELENVIVALGETRHPLAFEPLLRLLEDKRFALRRAAAVALGEFGDRRAVPALISRISDRTLTVREEAVSSLVTLKDPRVLEPFKAVLTAKRREFSGRMKLEVVEGLSVLGDVGALSILVDAWVRSPIDGRTILAAVYKLFDLPGIEEQLKALGPLVDAQSRIFRYFIEEGFLGNKQKIREWVCQSLQGGRAIADYFEQHPASLATECVRKRLKETAFPEVLDVVERFERQQESQRQATEVRSREEARLREEEIRRAEEQRRLEEENRLLEEERQALLNKSGEIIETIRGKVSDRLGLEMDHEGLAAESNGGHYGGVTMEFSMRPELSQVMELRQYLSKVLHIEIEMGETMEELRERVRILNIVVPHEVAHVIQDKLGIQPPRFDFSSLKHLSPQAAAQNANETLIDKLGFDAARMIYVSGDGDLLLDEEGREAVAIHAHAALMEIILRNLTAGLHHFGEEILARFIAVTQELAGSEAIGAKMKGRLNALAKELSDRTLEGKDPATSAEIESLTETYRDIFRQARLPMG